MVPVSRGQGPQVTRSARRHHSHRHSHHVPAVTTVVDTPERMAVAFEVIDSLTAGGGLVTAESVLTPHPAGVPAGYSIDFR